MDRTLWLDDFTEEENLALKSLYTALSLSTKEVTILELKRSLELNLLFMRKRKAVSRQLDEVYNYLEMRLKRDLASQKRYRISLGEFYQMWQSAMDEKYPYSLNAFCRKVDSRKIEEEARRMQDKRDESAPGRDGWTAGCCQRRDKLDESIERMAEIASANSRSIKLLQSSKERMNSIKSTGVESSQLSNSGGDDLTTSRNVKLVKMFQESNLEIESIKSNREPNVPPL